MAIHTHKKQLSLKARDRELMKLIRERSFYHAASTKPKLQSKIIDSLVFPNKQKIEKKLVVEYDDLRDVDYRKEDTFDQSQPWIGIDPQLLETTYLDFAQLFEFLESENISLERIIDIGSAYGRAGIVASSIFPKSQFIGYEIVPERVEESNQAFKRLELKNCQSVVKNVLLEDIGEANLYIVYDFSHKEDIHDLFKKLLDENGKKPFMVAAIGGTTPEVIYHHFSSLRPVAVPPERRGWYLFRYQPS